ncbi:MAG: type IV secretion system DNA-binding domain-containing protein [Candidatus Moranbacteria bacterium]|nr:type IV secretion system DNA-binding domain-containing protein [Candidatus Moranbacteria bacterium]
MINFFAKTNFRNSERIFGIKEDDRRRHMYVIGKTGMGKSNMLENMAIQDIRAGKGLCVVDPHGEFAEKMMRAIPSERINDVVYFNPADSEFPVSFNILESVDEDKKNLVASGMMGVFKKIWPDVWSARMEYILNNTILALLDYPGSTMLGVNRMMSDKDYRKRIYTKIKDPVVKSFWINEFDQWDDKFRKEAVAAIQNKVGQFLSYTLIRHIIGQPKSTIDMREIMDNQKILIINLSKGRIGEDAMRLLGGMIITKIQLAAMSRVDMPEEERKDFYLYVDEFQNFATDSFANILSEARKYRLCLILAHQYIRQLVYSDGSTTVRDAVFGNVGTIVSFRVGAEDAEALEKEFEPVFMMNDIVNLSKYNIYLKLMIDGITGDAFSAATLAPIDISDTAANEKKAIDVSRERYGRSRLEVEEKIARWSGMMEFEDFKMTHSAPAKAEEKQPEIKREAKPAPVPSRPVVSAKANDASQNIQPPVSVLKIEGMNQSEKDETAEKPERQMFETVCDTCEEKIMVPFKPMPGRPTFCKECLKEYQRARAKAQESRNAAGNSANPSRVQEAPVPDAKKEMKAYEERPAAYIPREKPMNLSQLSHVAPKKFKSERPGIDLESVRKMINQTRNKGSENGSQGGNSPVNNTEK